MDRLSNLKYAEGSRKKRKRIGRGEGSGHGGTATRGMNGQRSRSGARRYKPGFEGGQMPLQRRVPKYGFTNIFKVKFQVVNLYQIQKLIETKNVELVDFNAEVFLKLGLISSAKSPFKVLGTGDLKTKINISANAFSESAKQKIEAVGGTVTIV
jgi:large subunit ribosomal protein L15